MKIILGLLVLFLFQSDILNAQEKSFIKEYTYKAGELDSKLSCRAVVIDQLRTILLQEIGVYVESEQFLKTSDVGGQFSQDFVENIAIISAGITKLEVVEEKWTGETYWMKAAITVDPRSLQESLNRLINDKNRVKELESLKEELDKTKEQLSELRKQSLESRPNSDNTIIKNQYNNKIIALNSTEFIISGLSKYDVNDFKGAIEDFSVAIAIDPRNARAYLSRANAELSLVDTIAARYGLGKQYDETIKAAISDYTRGIDLSSGRTREEISFHYTSRGIAKSKSTIPIKDDEGRDRWTFNHEEAIVDFTRAINSSLSPIAYYYRGISRMSIGNTLDAITDFTISIKLDPQNPDCYSNRGDARYQNDDYKSAVEDYTRAIEIDPSNYKYYVKRFLVMYEFRDGDYSILTEDANKLVELLPNEHVSYAGRGLIRAELKDQTGAIKDFNKAIALDTKNKNSGLYYYRRGLSKMALNQKENACKDLKIAVKTGYKTWRGEVDQKEIIKTCK